MVWPGDQINTCGVALGRRLQIRAWIGCHQLEQAPRHLHVIDGFVDSRLPAVTDGDRASVATEGTWQTTRT